VARRTHSRQPITRESPLPFASSRFLGCRKRIQLTVIPQLMHAVAVLVARDHPVAASCFTAGMTLFSGSIYALTLNTERFRFLGPVTPLGGLFLMAGWAALAFGKGGNAPRLPRF